MHVLLLGPPVDTVLCALKQGFHEGATFTHCGRDMVYWIAIVAMLLSVNDVAHFCANAQVARECANEVVAPLCKTPKSHRHL